ncbi:universal stress protein [Calycomorphotria hydatis]|uniref:Universal stress protein n=1 Tax=Calycomorphotria hydatis TaxID=2528027 RepID=A0A517T7Q4_9PLAN|nr:universal stress protein [Calycomorphotria hydatis]QDT64406.1 Putative universal stress protein [Calycomorphotria hydatis]
MPATHETVVVPIDFSQETERLVRIALDHASAPENLHVLHVLYPLDYVSPGVLLGDVSEAEREKEVNKKFDELRDALGGPAFKTTVLMGDPGIQICEYADEHKADLIVVTSHGYHGLKRLFLGSTAERIIRHAHCSVLVLRRTDAE